MYQGVVHESLDDEPREVDTDREVAFTDRVAHVSAPYRQTLTLTLVAVAAAHLHEASQLP